MLKSKKNRFGQLFGILLVAVFLFVPLRFDKSQIFSVIRAEDALDDGDDYFDNGYEYIEEGNVTWGKGDHIIEKGLEIAFGGTLTIEKGARILLRKNPEHPPYIRVGGTEGGRIIVNGTLDEKVTFASTENDGEYNIYFNDGDDIGESFFRYAEFIGSEKVIYDEGMVSMLRDMFVDTANAAKILQVIYSSFINYDGGKVHIENSTFQGVSVSDNAEIREESVCKDGYLEIINSNFESDSHGIVVSSDLRCYAEMSDSECKNKLLLKNNWYGDSRGPIAYAGSLDETDGLYLAGKYTLDGWRTNAVIADPAILIPGIMGSSEVLGKWKLDPMLHIYDDLVASFKQNGYTDGKNFFKFPYNWRKSNVETAGYLKDAIDATKNLTKISKVDLVAHSMGGLVARSYIEGGAYGNDVDQLITVATPHRGSPEAYLKWEAGEGFFTLEDRVAKCHFENEAEHAGYDDLQKYIQEKVVSVGELLPDYDYLFDVAENEMRDYPDNYPVNSFLENLNDDVNAQSLKKVDFINIVGKVDDDNKTITKIRVVNSSSKNKWKYGIPENFDNKQTNQGLERNTGDETVPIYSATAIESNKEIILDAPHQDIPKIAQCEIIRDLTGKVDCAYVDDWHMINILLLDVFSPIDIQVISPSGKKYGKNFASGETFASIGGSYYTGSDTENEYLTIPDPEEGEYKIIARGTGNGEYEIKATKVSENLADSANATETTTTFNGVAAIGSEDEMKVVVDNTPAADSDEEESSAENDDVVSSSDDVVQIADAKVKNDDDTDDKKKSGKNKKSDATNFLTLAVSDKNQSNKIVSLLENDGSKKEYFKNENQNNDPRVAGETDEKTITKEDESRGKFLAGVSLVAVLILSGYFFKGINIIKYFKGK